MNKFLKILFMMVASTACIEATDYCRKGLCTKNGTTHIACDRKKEFAPSCSKDAALINITTSLKDIITDSHNKYRDIIASGGEASLKPACRMATMEWDDELESLAEYNVMQCVMMHDNCHNTDTFSHSGQNLAIIAFKGSFDDKTEFLLAIKLWFEEKQYVNQSIIDKYPNNYTGPKIGHFTVMVADRNIRLGCAASTFSKPDNFSYYLIACNYATNNIIGYPIYKSCNESASNCETGTNESYKSLCSTSEPYDVNKFP